MKLKYVIFTVGILVCLTVKPAGAIQLGTGVALPLQGQFVSPVWSPTGEGLALAGDRFQGLYYADLMGNLKQISDMSLAGWEFSWSPDGQALGYRVRQGDDDTAMAAMITCMDGKTQQVSPWENDMLPPKWGKDGLTYRTGDELVTVDKDGNIKSTYSFTRGRGLLSKIVSIFGSLMLMDVTGATLTAYGSLVSAGQAEVKPPAGVYVDSDNQLWAIDENGNRKKLLEGEDEAGYNIPVESPHGDKYAVEGFGGKLYVVDKKGGLPVDLGPGSNPSWSPDGKYLIYEVTSDDGHSILSSDLWVSSVDGFERYQLTNTPGIESWPSWSPDGKYIAYVIDGVVYIAPIQQ
ncbi:MAG: hypothetical protein QME62_01255 [Armatimonadota bacterium]|nr:hypothetical protein [Armatimonadota bacterium]